MTLFGNSLNVQTVTRHAFAGKSLCTQESRLDEFFTNAGQVVVESYQCKFQLTPFRFNFSLRYGTSTQYIAILELFPEQALRPAIAGRRICHA